MKKGKLIIFTGPSAVGKATVEKILFKMKDLKLKFSISATTRKIRQGEKHGVHYFFLTHDEFDKKIKANEFVEWSYHFNNRYGTLKLQVTKILSKNCNAFLEIDVNGARDILLQYSPDELISIFLAPPSKDELEKRIRNRGTENETQIIQRLKRVDSELENTRFFDYVVINDDPKKAAQEIAKIILEKI